MSAQGYSRSRGKKSNWKFRALVVCYMFVGQFFVKKARNYPEAFWKCILYKFWKWKNAEIPRNNARNGYFQFHLQNCKAASLFMTFTFLCTYSDSNFFWNVFNFFSSEDYRWKCLKVICFLISTVCFRSFKLENSSFSNLSVILQPLTKTIRPYF